MEIAAEQHAALRGQEPTLLLDHYVDADLGHLRITVGTSSRPAARVAHIDLEAIDRAERERFSPLRLMAAALVDDITPQRAGIPEVERSKRPSRDAVAVLDPTTERLRLTLTQRRNVVLVGGSGTHKSQSAAGVADLFESDGHACAWLDMRDGRAGAETIAWEILRLPRHEKLLVVINQVQDGMSEVRPVLHLTRLLRTEFRVRTFVLATSRPAAVDTSRGLFRSFTRVPIQTTTVRFPAEPELREALHWFACLKLFEIRPLLSTVSRRFPQSVVDRLTSGNQPLLSRTSAHYSLASGQDAATLIRNLRSPTTPGDVVWAYLKLIGHNAGRDLMRRLDQGDVVSESTASQSYLAPAWDLLHRLGDTLDAHCELDPSWGGNVGAAVFAAEALAELDHRAQWETVARYVRTSWRYDRPGVLPEPARGRTSEYADFLEIARYMDIEDEQLVQAHLGLPPGHELSDDIDLDRFHRTWMLGVLLGFEGSALSPTPGRDALIRTADEECHPSLGYFYPRRVPWVTARVLLGLSRVGRTYQNSDTVQRACEWLKRPLRSGGPYGLWWKGGTGSWNRDEATTAMCVAALIRAGDGETPEVRTALAWLSARAGEWTKTDREIDLAIVLEAAMLGAADWRASYARILNLLHWSAGEIQRMSSQQPDPRFVPESALRAPFAAAQLATLVRVAVGRESEALLDAAAHRRIPRQRGTGLDPADSLASTAAGVTDVRPMPSLERWRRAGALIAETLETSLRARSAVQRADPGRQASEIWEQAERDRTRLNLYRELADQLDELTPREVLQELNRLGREVCETRWDDGLTFENQGHP
ncbi:hypothetical protein [Paractinoplanes rishiriensis]|uniref:Uncharacterized protein n=1 Tax=Paractinoplanes rishiriensis TaxID=1050105 RepID=A0A919K705_9ACTN|nr:hypothetical protein [Actinoplanes rishiriensis]GIE99678.1 hypothetical protein Ari01nite_71430 [Actinoplanes rishiriensis]